MAANFKKRIRKLLIRALFVFILMFLFRMIYGYVNPESGGSEYYGNDFFSSLDNVRKNYASEKIMSKGDANSGFAANQKFEKTASNKSC